ncbi:MAG: hypothetical protein CL678_05210 [Bdellovibrionaceae bacterium]|nr:hypothetical protein [Pseudobdellovibrionaceae bacterium]
MRPVLYSLIIHTILWGILSHKVFLSTHRPRKTVTATTYWIEKKLSTSNQNRHGKFKKKKKTENNINQKQKTDFSEKKISTSHFSYRQLQLWITQALTNSVPKQIKENQKLIAQLILSPEGKIKEVRLTQRSGNQRFDRWVLSRLQNLNSIPIKNPPTEVQIPIEFVRH